MADVVFRWNELITRDQHAAGDFYSALLGWERREVDAGPLGTYTIFSKDGEDLAGMMNPTIDYTRALGSRWYAYVGVDDVDHYVQRAQQVGGELIAGPDDIPGVGRVALLADPTGALIRLMQATTP